jgi:cytochrome c551
MRRSHLLVICTAVVVLLGALVLASCGGSSTATTAAPAGSSTTAGGATTTAGGATTTAGAAVDAAALYQQNCAGCHKSPPSGSADSIKAAITNGKGSMPSFGGKLTDAQIAALAAWVANGGK